MTTSISFHNNSTSSSSILVNNKRSTAANSSTHHHLNTHRLNDRSSNYNMTLVTSTEDAEISKEINQKINCNELQRKKEELMKRISQKLNVLRAEQLSLKEEISLNDELGRSISTTVRNLAKQNEFDKFTLHVQEIDKITSLLLGLSGRLARIENNLLSFSCDDTSDEKKILIGKRDKLIEQLDEAKRLKENIDKRSSMVSNFLHRYLNVEQYADYDHFVKMKAKLIMDSREISDKIQLGEEQLHALQNSLYLSQNERQTPPR